MVPTDLLRDSMIFSGCTEQDLLRLGEIAVTREFDDGQLLFSFGDEAREVMIVSSGKVQLEFPVSVLGQTRSITFETKTRGSAIGWSALASPNRFTLSCRAIGRTAVAVFSQEELNGLFETDMGLGFRVLRNTLSIVRLRLERTHKMWVREIQLSLDERYR